MAVLVGVALVVGVRAPMRVGVLYAARVAVAVPTERLIDQCSLLRHGSQATHAAASRAAYWRDGDTGSCGGGTATY